MPANAFAGAAAAFRNGVPDTGVLADGLTPGFVRQTTNVPHIPRS